MTGEDYIEIHKTEKFRKGDKVVMHTCMEAEHPKYNGKIWTCKTDSFLDRAKQEVVFLEGYIGYFMTEFLQGVNGIS